MARRLKHEAHPDLSEAWLEADEAVHEWLGRDLIPLDEESCCDVLPVVLGVPEGGYDQIARYRYEVQLEYIRKLRLLAGPHGLVIYKMLEQKRNEAA